MNDSEFLDLLRRSEGETLDFKSTAYNLASDLSKADFIKKGTGNGARSSSVSRIVRWTLTELYA